MQGAAGNRAVDGLLAQLAGGRHLGGGEQPRRRLGGWTRECVWSRHLDINDREAGQTANEFAGLRIVDRAGESRPRRKRGRPSRLLGLM